MIQLYNVLTRRDFKLFPSSGFAFKSLAFKKKFIFTEAKLAWMQSQ